MLLQQFVKESRDKYVDQHLINMHLISESQQSSTPHLYPFIIFFPQGLLSFLEVTKDIIEDHSRPSTSGAHPAPSHDEDGGGLGCSSVKYGLLLHGTCTLPSVCMSMCTATPEWTLSTKERTEVEKGIARDDTDIWSRKGGSNAFTSACHANDY